VRRALWVERGLVAGVGLCILFVLLRRVCRVYLTSVKVVGRETVMAPP